MMLIFLIQGTEKCVQYTMSMHFVDTTTAAISSTLCLVANSITSLRNYFWDNFS